MGTDKPFEGEARRVLQSLLGGRVVDRDVGGAQGVRDFDLVDSAGNTAHAVEVTSAQHSSVRAARTALRGLQDEEIGLHESWSAAVHEVVRVQPIRREAARHLNTLTDLGISAFSPPSRPVPSTNVAADDAIRHLQRLGILSGRALPDLVPARLVPSVYGVGSLDAVRVTNSVQEQLDKTDNRRKLGAAPDGAKRHLFVGLDHSDWYVSSQLLGDDLQLPPPPDLPEEVDYAWIAVEDPETGQLATLLRVHADEIVALDPETGKAIVRRTSDGGPPTAPPSCPTCGGSCHWEPRQRSRYDPKSARRDQAWTWAALCNLDPEHVEAPGRTMTKREQREHGVT